MIRNSLSVDDYMYIYIILFPLYSANQGPVLGFSFGENQVYVAITSMFTQARSVRVCFWAYV